MLVSLLENKIIIGSTIHTKQKAFTKGSMVMAIILYHHNALQFKHSLVLFQLNYTFSYVELLTRWGQHTLYYLGRCSEVPPLLVGLTLTSDFSKDLEIEDVFLAHYPYKRKRNNKDDTISLDFKIILVCSYSQLCLTGENQRQTQTQ